MAAGAERAVVVDDAELVAPLLGVGGEAVGGEGVGDGVERGAERPLTGVAAVGRHARRPWPARTRSPTSSAICSASAGGSRASDRPSRVSTRSSVRDPDLQRHLLVVGLVALGGPAGAAALGPLDGDVEVAAGGELVEVVAGDVRVEPEALGHLGGRDAALVLVGEQVDLAPGRVTEGVRDGGDRSRESARGQLARDGGLRLHPGILPIAHSGNRKGSRAEASGPWSSVGLRRRACMPVTSVTTEQVLEALRPVEDPELHRSIVDLGMVRDIGIDGGRVSVLVALTVAGCPLRNEITNRVTAAVTALDGVDAVGLDFTVMTDEEREELRQRLHGDPAATAGHGTPGPRARRRPRHPLRRAGLEDPPAADRVGQGRRRQELGHHQPRRRSGPGGLLGRRASTPTSTASRSRACSAPTATRSCIDEHAPAARAVGRAVHLDRLLRARRPGRDLAGPDAAQGPRAVPHRRLLGRPRLPARRHAAGHRRHRPVARRSTCPGPRSTSSPRRSRRPRRWPACRRRWPSR